MRNSKILLGLLLLGTSVQADPCGIEVQKDVSGLRPRQKIVDFRELDKEVPESFDFMANSVIFSNARGSFISDPKQIIAEIQKGAQQKFLVRQTDRAKEVEKYLGFACASYDKEYRVDTAFEDENGFMVLGDKVDLTPKEKKTVSKDIDDEWVSLEEVDEHNQRQKIIMKYGEENIRTFRSSTQEAGFITYEPSQEGARAKLIFSIHGTSTLQDIITDLKGAKNRTSKYLPGISAHRGFVNYYESYQEDMWQNALQLAEARGQSLNDLDLVFNGHSLGGAQAQLAAYHAKKFFASGTQRVDVYTYHAPGVVDEPSARVIEEAFADTGKGRIFRVVKEGDAVSNVGPNLICFQHVGTEYLIKDSTQYGPGFLAKWEKMISRVKNVMNNHSTANTQEDFRRREKRVESNERSRSNERVKFLEEKSRESNRSTAASESSTQKDSRWFAGWRAPVVKPVISVDSPAVEQPVVTPKNEAPQSRAIGWGGNVKTSQQRSKAVEQVRPSTKGAEVASEAPAKKGWFSWGK